MRARRWRRSTDPEASREAREPEDPEHPCARGVRADEAAARDQHRHGERRTAGAGGCGNRRRHHGPCLPVCRGPSQPRADRATGAGDGRDGEGRCARAVRDREEAAREATRSSACTTSCCSRCPESTWRSGTRSARRSGNPWCACSAACRGRCVPTTPRDWVSCPCRSSCAKRSSCSTRASTR